MMIYDNFQALTPETLGARLGTLDILRTRVGEDPSAWSVREVGDGNLNLVFVVGGPTGSLIVKQALPYVRLVGDSWPLPLKRSFFEYNALMRQEARDPGRVPEILHFDEGQAIIIMEYLTPHVILRRALIAGQKFPNIARDLGLFMARTLFRGSDLSMNAAARKADLALFAGNAELCDITETLVFSDPYFNAKLNRHTSPQLDSLVAELRAGRDLKVEAQRLKHLFVAKAETLVHGDLHSGSVMVTDMETRVIDPEFAFYGPMALDVGMLLANYWMSFFSQSGHELNGNRDSMRTYLLNVIGETWTVFTTEFSHLWRTERTGILYEKSLFEDQGDFLGSEQALQNLIQSLYVNMLGFAGIEIHRRILGLAHNADFETIDDVDLRAACEARALKFGRHLAVNRHCAPSLESLNDLANLLQKDSVR